MCGCRENTANDFEAWLNEDWEPVSLRLDPIPADFEPQHNLKFRVLSFQGYRENSGTDACPISDFDFFELYMHNSIKRHDLESSISLMRLPVWRIGCYHEPTGPIVLDVVFRDANKESVYNFHKLHLDCWQFARTRCHRVDVSEVFMRRCKKNSSEDQRL